MTDPEQQQEQEQEPKQESEQEEDQVEEDAQSSPKDDVAKNNNRDDDRVMCHKLRVGKKLLQAQLAAALQKIHELQNVQDDKAEKVQDAQELQAKLDAALQQVQKLKQDNRALLHQENDSFFNVKEISRLESKIVDLEVHVSTLKVVNKELQDQNIQLLHHTETLKEKHAQSFAELQEFMQVQPSVAKLQMTNKDLQHEVWLLNKEHHTLLARDEKRQAKVLELERTNQELQERVNRLQEENDKLPIAALRCRVAELEGEKNSLHEVMQEYMEQANAAEKAQLDLDVEVTRLGMENESLTCRLEMFERKATNNDDDDDDDDTKDMIQWSADKLKELQEKIITLEYANKKLQQEVERCQLDKQKLASTELRLAIVKADKRELMGKMETVNREKEIMETELSELKDADRKRRHSCNANSFSTVNILDDEDPFEILVRENSEMAASLATLKESETTLFKERERLVSAAANMSLTLTECRAKVDLLELQLEEAKVAHRVLEESSGRGLSSSGRPQTTRFRRLRNVQRQASFDSQQSSNGSTPGPVTNGNNNDDTAPLTENSESSASRLKNFFSRTFEEINGGSKTNDADEQEHNDAVADFKRMLTV